MNGIFARLTPTVTDTLRPRFTAHDSDALLHKCTALKGCYLLENLSNTSTQLAAVSFVALSDNIDDLHAFKMLGS